MYFLLFSALESLVPTCKASVDLGFILDSSGSLSADYGKEKAFLKTLARSFEVNRNGTRAGVITFSSQVDHSIKLNDHLDIASFEAAVDEIPLMGSTTRIDRALRLAQVDMFSLVNGGRVGKPKILVLITDGSQTLDSDTENPSQIAEEIRSAGIKLIVIGIGAGIDQDELLRIAGDKNDVFSASSFEELIASEFGNVVTKRSCTRGKMFSFLFQFFVVVAFK